MEMGFSRLYLSSEGAILLQSAFWDSFGMGRYEIVVGRRSLNLLQLEFAKDEIVVLLLDCYQTEYVSGKAVYFLYTFYPTACVSTHAVVFCGMNGRQMPLSPAPTSSSVPLGLIRRGYVSYRYIGPSVTP